MIKVYSKPDCQQCNATYRTLDKQGIAYQIIDVTKDDKALTYIQALGYRQVPVVVAGKNHWAGFQPEKIKTIQ